MAGAHNFMNRILKLLSPRDPQRSHGAFAPEGGDMPRQDLTMELTAPTQRASASHTFNNAVSFQGGANS